jgi:hypothetical protein
LVRTSINASWGRFLQRLGQTPDQLQRFSESTGRYTSLNTTIFWRAARVEVRAHHGSLKARDVKPWIEFTQRVIDRVKQGRLYLTPARELERLVATPRRRLESLMMLVAGHPIRRSDADNELVSAMRRFIRRRQPTFFGRRGGARVARAVGATAVDNAAAQPREQQVAPSAPAGIGRVVLSL